MPSKWPKLIAQSSFVNFMKFAVLSFMDFCKEGILEFPASLRGSKAEGAISKNSGFYLEFPKPCVIPRPDP